MICSALDLGCDHDTKVFRRIRRNKHEGLEVTNYNRQMQREHHVRLPACAVTYNHPSYTRTSVRFASSDALCET